MANADQRNESVGEASYGSGDYADGAPRKRRRSIGHRLLQAIVALGMALVVGAVAALAAAELGYAGPAFALAFVASAAYLYAKPLPSAAIGSGLYLAALLLVATPVLYLLPEIGDESGVGDAVEAGPIVDQVTEIVAIAVAIAVAIVDAAVALLEAGTETTAEAFGEPLGLAAWILAFVLLALVTGTIGYLLNRRAGRKLARDERGRRPAPRVHSDEPRRRRTDGGGLDWRRTDGGDPDRRRIDGRGGRRRSLEESRRR